MARRQFGNMTRVREDTRAMWSFPALDTIVQDLRYGARMMRRSPAVSLVAILSLGLGIGGAAAVFGLADVLLVRQLPVRAPEQLAVFRWSSGPVSVFESLNGNAQRDERDFSVSSTSFSRPAFEAMRSELADRAEVFRIRRSVQAQPLRRRTRRRRQRPCRVGKLLQRARPLCRRRPPDYERRRSSRRAARGRHQSLRVAAPVRRRIGDRQADGAERHPIHGNRGGAGGLPRHRAGRPGIRRDRADGGLRCRQPLDSSGLTQLLVGPGDGQAASRRTARTGAAGGRPDRQAHHGGGAATAHAAGSAPGGGRAWKPRADREPQLGPRAAHDNGADHRHRSAGRLRQRRQPDARARPRPREGADRPRRDRRGPCPRGPAAGDGRIAARRGRRRARAAAGQVRCRRIAAGAHRVGFHPRRRGALLARWSFHDGSGDGLHAAVRRRPGAARDRSAARLGASGSGAGQHHRPPAQPAGGSARGRAGRLVAAAADGGGAAGHLAARTRTDRPRLRSRERAHVQARPTPERLRRAARTPPDGERARAPARHSRRTGGVVLEPWVDCGTVRRHRGTAGRNAVSRAWRPRVAAIHRRASRLAPGRR